MNTDDHRNMCLALKSVMYQMENCDKALFSKFDMTPTRYDIMRIIFKHPGINYNDLSNLICCTKGNASRIVSSLMEDGLITRKDNPEDRRSYFLYLTTRGTQLF